MCAEYGLGGGEWPDNPPPLFSIAPLGEPAVYEHVRDWSRMYRGRARITGRNALNLNPLIRVEDGARQLDFGWWSLWINGILPPKLSTFNARDDKLTTSTFWREPFVAQRALLPATWYVEKKKTFELDGQLLGIAAIYQVGTTVDEPPISYSMVTRDAVSEAATANNRMPLILPAEFHDDWLDPQTVGDEELVKAAVAASEEISESVRIRVDTTGAPALF